MARRLARASSPLRFSGLFTRVEIAPLEEAIDGHNAATLRIGIPEHREPRDAFGPGVDRLAATLWPRRTNAVSDPT